MRQLWNKAKCLIREGRYKELFYRALKKALKRIKRTLHIHCYTPFVMSRIKNDTRFKIVDTRFIQLLYSAPIKRYKLSIIKLGDIQRQWKYEPKGDKLIPLTETAVYSFLEGNDEPYREYIRRICTCVFHFDSSIIEDKIDKDILKFNETIRSVADNGYDILKGIIVVAGDQNLVIDGLHRSCILLKEFGSELEIPVLKVWFA